MTRIIPALLLLLSSVVALFGVAIALRGPLPNPYLDAGCEVHSKTQTTEYRSGPAASRRYETITTWWCPGGFYDEITWEPKH